MDFDAFIEAAWADHADQPEAVAERLASASHALARQQLAAWARLWVHVTGEHLGQWQRGEAALARLRPAANGAEAATIDRSIATLRVTSGDDQAADGLPAEDRVVALATAATALAGRAACTRALTLMDAALGHFAAAAAGGQAASRALAVAGNNIAAALEEQPELSATERAGMLRAAQAGLLHWAACGGWLETERAAFRLASAAARAGDAAQAVAAATQCLDLCEKNRADAFERFFAHAVLARARHLAANEEGFRSAKAAALSCHAAIEPDNLRWCAAELAALDALGPAGAPSGSH